MPKANKHSAELNRHLVAASAGSQLGHATIVLSTRIDGLLAKFISKAMRNPTVELHLTQAEVEYPTVLIVENETLIALAIEESLEDAGYRIVGVANANGAIAAMDAEPMLSAAIVNLNLGDGSTGQEVILHLRHRDPHLPIIVLTGYMPRDAKADLRGLGGPTVRMHKPHDFDELLRILEHLLKRPDRMPSVDRRAY